MMHTERMSGILPSAFAAIAISLAWGCGGDAADAGTDDAAQLAANHPGQAIFERNCFACHTIGEGVRVGPDLKDVHQRRERGWLERWVADPLGMAENDPIGQQIFAEFNNVPMAPSFLSDEEIVEVLDYIQLVSTGELVVAARAGEGPVELTDAEFARGQGIFLNGWSRRPASSTFTARHTTSTDLSTGVRLRAPVEASPVPGPGTLSLPHSVGRTGYRRIPVSIGESR